MVSLIAYVAWMGSARWIPHVTSNDGGFQTAIIVTNLSSSDQSVTLTPYDLIGLALTPVQAQVPANGFIKKSKAEWFGSEEVSHFSISGSTSCKVSVVYRVNANLIGASAHSQETDRITKAYIFYPGEWDVVWDGMALVNLGHKDAEVHILTKNASGVTTSDTAITDHLAPLAKQLIVFADVLSDPGDDQIVVTSSEWSCAAVLRGSLSGEPRYLYETQPLIGEQTSSVVLSQIQAPMVLNSTLRGLFADVIIDDKNVLTTYQLARQESLTEGKNLYYQVFSRDLTNQQPETVAIDVQSSPLFQGDLGDHKLTLMGDFLYMVAILKGHDQAAVLKWDKAFNLVKGPTYVGDPSVDQFADMGICDDGQSIYVQFFHQAVGGPENWGAKIIQLNSSLDMVKSGVIHPESGSFVTGTSLVYIPAGQMDVLESSLQSFSTNSDYGNADPIGIHTFRTNSEQLTLIPQSTQTLITKIKDVYFPTGACFNQKHQLWLVGYTMESATGNFPNIELGPSFLTVFDAQWNQQDEISLNQGRNAMRVMVDSLDDDVYVVYDEMDVLGQTEDSTVRIEAYRIVDAR